MNFIVVSSSTLLNRTLNRTAGISRCLVVLVLLSGMLCGMIGGCFRNDDPVIAFDGKTMGTTYSVTLAAPPASVDAVKLQQKMDSELARLNSLMSSWDEESELSRFNKQYSNDWIPVSRETINLLRVAKRISKETSGAYDVTLGSVSRLWGFHAEATQQIIEPNMDQVFDLLNSVGYQLIQESRDGNNIRKLAVGLQIDLSSIAKGYAVDRLGEILEAEGVARYLVEIGGEIRTRGMAANGKRWKIGIEWPVPHEENVSSGILVENAHVASSGDYRNYRIVDGQRVSHLLDGRSGYPVSHTLAAVTVLHGTVAQADAWATAFMVLGLEEALSIAISKGLAARFTLREADTFKVITTPAFDAYSFTER